MVELSIVVCTFNRAELLRECLTALIAELDERCELIVVDNNSTDGSSAVAADVIGSRSDTRVVREPSQGLSFARNCGLREAKGSWIAYVDDDALAESGYVQRALATAATGQFDAFGGVFLPWYKYGRPAWYRDEYASNANVQSTLGILPESQFMSGGNAVFHRRVFDRVGDFSGEIGMRGKLRSYGEETLLQVRMRRAGLRIGFDPQLVVRHLVSQRKMTVSGLLHDSFAAGRDSFTAFDLEPSFRRRASALVAGLAYARRLPGLVRKLAQRDYHVENFVLDVCTSPAYHFGQFASREPEKSV